MTSSFKAEALSESIRVNEFDNLLKALLNMGIETTPIDAASVAMVCIEILVEFSALATGLPPLRIVTGVPLVKKELDKARMRLS
jgi:hypothetical protein